MDTQSSLNFRKLNYPTVPPSQSFTMKRNEALVQLRRKKRGQQTAKRRAITTGAAYILNLATKENTELGQIPTNLTREAPELSNPQTRLEDKLLLLRTILSKQSDTHTVLEGLEVIMRLTQEEGVFALDTLIYMGFVPILQKFIAPRHHSSLVLCALNCLCNLCCTESDTQNLVFKYGVVDNLLTVISARNLGCSCLSIKALANLCTDSYTIRQEVTAAGAFERIDELVQGFRDMREELMTSLAHFVFSFGASLPELGNAELGRVLQWVGRLITSTTAQVKEDCLGALDCIVISSNSHWQSRLILEYNLWGFTVNSLSTENSEKSLLCALRVIGNILCEEHSEALEHGAITKVYGLLSYPKALVKQKCLWVLSNIAANGPVQIQLLIDYNVTQECMRFITNSDQNIQLRAAKFYRNCVKGGTEEQRCALVDMGIL